MSFDYEMQIEDTRDFADWQDWQEMNELEEIRELNAWYDSHYPNPDEIDAMYESSLPSMYALRNL